jgi:hypothetical protein
MFCPVCEAEYQPGIKRCPDDDTDLVEHLDLKTSTDDSEARFVHLHHLGSQAEAEMVNDLLRQNGIRSVVQAGGSNALSPLLAASEGAIVLVDERDLDRAQEIYGAFFGNDTTPLTGPAFEDEENEEDDEQ